MTQQRDDVAPVIDHKSNRMKITAVIAVAVLISAGIIIAVTHGHSRPTPKPAHPLLVKMPPLNPLLLGILNTGAGRQWHGTKLGETPGETSCPNILNNIYTAQQCDYIPALPDKTQALYISVVELQYSSPEDAYETYIESPQVDSKPMPGVGDAAVAGVVSQYEHAPTAPSQLIALTGTNVFFVYRQTIFDVWYCGASYKTAPDGALTNVKGFSFDEALGEAKSLAQRIIAKLPLKS